MNNHLGLESRDRGKTLLIVEGNHEKNELFWLIFKCFPELQIDFNDVWIYGTNVYMLYDDIVREYDEDWDEIDVDLPYIVSKKKTPGHIQRKDDFINIFLVFDYERHDPNFSFDKIRRLQAYFSDSTDVGQLYLNYPMIESYQDMLNFPDDAFMDHKIPVTVRPGDVYKRTLRNSVIAHMTGTPQKIRGILKERFSMADDINIETCMLDILSLSRTDTFVDDAKVLLNNYIDNKKATTGAYQMFHIVKGIRYIDKNIDYITYMRWVFSKIIRYHICKADRVVSGDTSLENIRERFYLIDYNNILNIQNQISSDDMAGFIWVLNTSILLVPDYNLTLVEK